MKILDHILDYIANNIEKFVKYLEDKETKKLIKRFGRKRITSGIIGVVDEKGNVFKSILFSVPYNSIKELPPKPIVDVYNSDIKVTDKMVGDGRPEVSIRKFENTPISRLIGKCLQITAAKYCLVDLRCYDYMSKEEVIEYYQVDTRK